MPQETETGPNDPADEAWAVTPESTAQTEAAMADYKAGRTIGVEALDALIAAAGSKHARK